MFGLYLGGATFYNIKVNGMTTGEAFPPHPEFWASIPGLVTDGCVASIGFVMPFVNKLRNQSHDIDSAVDHMANDTDALMDDTVDDDY